ILSAVGSIGSATLPLATSAVNLTLNTSGSGSVFVANRDMGQRFCTLRTSLLAADVFSLTNAGFLIVATPISPSSTTILTTNLQIAPGTVNKGDIALGATLTAHSILVQTTDSGYVALNANLIATASSTLPGNVSIATGPVEIKGSVGDNNI